jgi:hypothetical protein
LTESDPAEPKLDPLETAIGEARLQSCLRIHMLPDDPEFGHRMLPSLLDSSVVQLLIGTNAAAVHILSVKA